MVPQHTDAQCDDNHKVPEGDKGTTCRRVLGVNSCASKCHAGQKMPSGPWTYTAWTAVHLHLSTLNNQVHVGAELLDVVQVSYCGDWHDWSLSICDIRYMSLARFSCSRRQSFLSSQLFLNFSHLY